MGEALRCGWRPRVVAVDVDGDVSDVAGACRQAGAVVHWVTADVLASVSDTRTPHAVVAVFDFATASTPLWPAVVAVGVSDPGNLGTILRTAEAAGAASVVLAGGCDVRSPKVVRAAAGAHFYVPLMEIKCEDAAHWLRGVTAGRQPAPAEVGEGHPLRDGDGSATGVESFALVLDGAESLWDVAPGPVATPRAVVVGSESHGLPSDVAAACSRRLYVPHRGRSESLNVGVAAGLASFWLLAGPAHGSTVTN